MIPALLISFRETIEAALIVATIIGILVKLKMSGLIKSVLLGTFSALCFSILTLTLGSFVGLEIHKLFEGSFEPIFEGSVMIISSFFITWAVFFLHTTFAHKKLTLLSSVQEKIATRRSQTIFFLVFTAVVREGLEIVLFLSTLFFSNKPVEIASGVGIGLLIACLTSYLLIKTTIKLPVFYAFRVTSILLILFAAGMLAQGYHDLAAEAHILPQFASLPTFTLFFLPHEGTFLGDLFTSLFGLAREMHTVSLLLWGFYTAGMSYLVFFRPHQVKEE